MDCHNTGDGANPFGLQGGTPGIGGETIEKILAPDTGLLFKQRLSKNSRSGLGRSMSGGGGFGDPLRETQP